MLSVWVVSIIISGARVTLISSRSLVKQWRWLITIIILVMLLSSFLLLLITEINLNKINSFFCILQWQYTRNKRYSICCLRGHIWCQECLRPSLRFQCMQPLPGCPVLPVDQGKKWCFSHFSALAVISSKCKPWLLVILIPFLFPESIVL